MKTCDYCGHENEDQAARCSECGTEFVVPAPKPEPTLRWDKIAAVDNEAEAERLDVELNSRQIPHIMRSYSDAVFSGIYQGLRGWGHVEGPEEHREAIITVLTDIRESRSEAADAGSETSG